MLRSVESITSLENQKRFIETACSIRLKMSKIHGMTENGSQHSFNYLLALMHQRDLIGTCNYFLEKLPEPMQFAFDFFPGPIEEAKKAQLLLEEKEQCQKKRRDAHERRAPLGFDSPTIRNDFPSFLRYILFKKFSEAQRAERNPESFVVSCISDGGIIYFRQPEEILGLMLKEKESKTVIRQVVDCRKCMQKLGSRCKTCSALSMLFHMSKDRVGFVRGNDCVSSEMVKSFIWTIMTDATFKNLHGVCLEVYLNTLYTGSEQFDKVTKPRILDAFKNPSGELARELVNAFSDYTEPFTDEQVEEMSERYSTLLEKWKTSFLKAELDSQYTAGKSKKQEKESDWSKVQFPR